MHFGRLFVDLWCNPSVKRQHNDTTNDETTKRQNNERRNDQTTKRPNNETTKHQNNKNNETTNEETTKRRRPSVNLSSGLAECAFALWIILATTECVISKSTTHNKHMILKLRSVLNGEGVHAVSGAAWFFYSNSSTPHAICSTNGMASLPTK